MKPYNFSIGDSMDLAERKMPDGWIAYKWESVNGGSLVTGSVPDGVYSRGPRKGKPRHTGKGDLVVVTTAELQAAAAEYESSTGKCWDCKGTGQTWAGWSKAEGTKYDTCRRCAGSGIAQRQEVAV